MGLDMYLYANSRELSKRVHESEPYGECLTDWYRRSGIVLYWRKANAIHKWFVDNVQYGKDDCGLYEVEVGKLVELRDICKRIVEECPLVDGLVRNGERLTHGGFEPIVEQGKVMSNTELAEELLPTTSGFFFGSTDYDQWYYSDVKYTAEELDRILSNLTAVKDENGFEDYVVTGEPDWSVRFTYHSSW